MSDLLTAADGDEEQPEPAPAYYVTYIRCTADPQHVFSCVTHLTGNHCMLTWTRGLPWRAGGPGEPGIICYVPAGVLVIGDHALARYLRYHTLFYRLHPGCTPQTPAWGMDQHGPWTMESLNPKKRSRGAQGMTQVLRSHRPTASRGLGSPAGACRGPTNCSALLRLHTSLTQYNSCPSCHSCRWIAKMRTG